MIRNAVSIYREIAQPVLVILFALSAVAVYGCLYSFQTPETITKNFISLTYTHTSEFNYTAFLKPSGIYNNQTIVRKDNSTTLYGTPLPRRLVEQIDIGVRYLFNQTPVLTNLTDIIVVYEVSTYLNASELIKVITYNKPIITTRSFIDEFSINVANLEVITDSISMETGLQTTNFTFTIHPKITVNASFHGDPVTLSYSHKFSVVFDSELVRMSGLVHEVSEQMRYPEEVIITWNSIPISFLRRGYLLFLFTSSLLIISTIRFLIEHRKWTNIVEVITLPQVERQQIILLSSFHDIVKVSKKLNIPIYHQGNTFLAIDKEQSYRFSHSRSNTVEQK